MSNEHLQMDYNLLVCVIKESNIVTLCFWVWTVPYNPFGYDQYIYYPPEVRRGEYWGWGVFLLQYFPLVKI